MTEKEFGGLIQRTLLGGVSISLLLFLSGAILRLGGSGLSEACLAAGVVALVLTPVARVAMLAYGFFMVGEYWLSAASGVVLALLAVSAML
ncbi:MAG: DUF1634 domain-containing protein [Elusimicrobia bacterium]|nr:DUF1634 domain-containing protein [Elusimicrobiota bacterium]